MIYNDDGWMWHRFDNGFQDSKLGDRCSFNVKADKSMLDELDNLIMNGIYKDANGIERTIPKNKRTNALYKTDNDAQVWLKRHDPVTVYFDDKVSDEMVEALTDISSRYKRSSNTPLMNSLDGKLWIVKETYITLQQAKDLHAKAEKLNPELANAMYHSFHEAGAWNVSTGQFAAWSKMLDEFQRDHNKF